jgi:nicotinamide-nucleotide amidase
MRILPDEACLTEAAARLLDQCRRAGLTIATAESCTGGLIVATLTAIPGCSDVVAGGFVTYSNALKSAALGVPPALIEHHGAVSEAVAVAMATGVLARSDADLAVAVTGIAGPGGGSAGPPPGGGGLWGGRPARACPTGAALGVRRRSPAGAQQHRRCGAGLAGLLWRR